MAVLVLLAAGCSRNDVLLEIQPAQVSECDLPVAVQVTWDASGRGLDLAQLEVHNPGRRPTLWIQNAAVGSAATGKWAMDGFTVTLRTREGRELARRSLTTTPCSEP
ncbi:hypothetical protein B1992_06780 [Pseudoxanthomonas broegbernensis]|uniref:Uncharacterized protein n=1 Tax=Pseudoxanthomonas broegbernensis TaxID=83619 RepID=A0A7V8K7I2_9GAMM|nr:hypothetical protein [Pseudoxanthomonas broegbernensis]KAF1686611.1 hypothetical protein B1992_06780 [Pseudoxanthomonas broegbernensis]MBB6063639.1 hypothetical protein [Pseudoxanthomonas broegbernensis]